ncbi:hypothetical protein PATA110616_20865 [Paenibacillus tarimensis]
MIIWGYILGENLDLRTIVLQMMLLYLDIQEQMGIILHFLPGKVLLSI